MEYIKLVWYSVTRPTLLYQKHDHFPLHNFFPCQKFKSEYILNMFSLFFSHQQLHSVSSVCKFMDARARELEVNKQNAWLWLMIVLRVAVSPFVLGYGVFVLCFILFKVHEIMGYPAWLLSINEFRFLKRKKNQLRRGKP